MSKTPRRAALERAWKMLEEIASEVGAPSVLDPQIVAAVKGRSGSSGEARRLALHVRSLEGAIRKYLDIRDEVLRPSEDDFKAKLADWKERHEQARLALDLIVAPEVPF